MRSWRYRSRMRFAKYQGLGNDFVLLPDPENRLTLTAELVRGLCDRRFGIGADGVIRVAPDSDGGELFMDYVNSDGSIGEMCGNGIRCLALYARRTGLTSAREIKVGTRAGTKMVEILGDDRVRVDMGPPIFAPADIPVAHEGDDALAVPLSIAPGGDGPLVAACLSMGNPHAVVFVEDLDAISASALGPPIETDDVFPHKANVEFTRVVAPDHIEVKVWERGAGETLACGTGACAAAVAARLLRGSDSQVMVALPGGDLEVEWGGSLTAPAPVYMTGPAVKSFEGEIELGDFA
jgi:diaminopimelate epimerase